MSSLSHSDRLRAVLSGTTPDRTPISLWRHWPEQDQSGPELARVTLDFQRRHDFDFVKLSPASNYSVDGWGGRSAWRSSPLGARQWDEYAVSRPEDWSKLQPLDPRAGLRGELLQAIRLLRTELGPDTPIIPTVFNPLAMAKYLAGESTLQRHLHEAPEAVHAGLRTLATSISRFLEEAKRCGIDGVFFAAQHASVDLLCEHDYRRFGVPYDLESLAPVSDLWFNLLHLHAPKPLFYLADVYPVAAVNWHAHETQPDLASAVRLTRKALCGGLGTLFPLRDGKQEDVYRAVAHARADVGPQRLILSAGCVLHLSTPEANLLAASKIARQHPTR